ncbi:MAG: electron transfer flavoprotein subunit alpha/FixB family protein [Magnetococcales bacterium]|nr:electron transfer flavoprotein subunit alpha/FixB family protein [Magnetococcales bacterium]
MSVLIVADHLGQGDSWTARLVGAARLLGSTVTVLVAGSGCQDAAVRLASLAGVDEVLYALHPAPVGVPVEDLAQLVLALAPGYTHVLATASTFGAELIPRVAAMLGVSPVTGVVEMSDRFTFTRPIHANGVLARLRVSSTPIFLTLQPWAFSSTGGSDGTPAPMRRIQDVPQLGLSWRMDFIPSTSIGQEDLSTAQVVVAGGGGLEKSGGFVPVQQLAKSLGGAVGASRAAVDAGLVPADLQIGQTGRSIAPKFYIALGISGAIQHVAGIKDAGTVVSINRDPQAPMAAMADLALTADLYEAVPALMEALGVK